MNDYYPIQCERCRKILGYSETDIGTSEYGQHIEVYCNYCVDIKPKEDKK